MLLPQTIFPLLSKQAITEYFVMLLVGPHRGGGCIFTSSKKNNGVYFHCIILNKMALLLVEDLRILIHFSAFKSSIKRKKEHGIVSLI